MAPLLLAFMVAATPVTPPLQPDLVQASLNTPPGTLLPELAAHPPHPPHPHVGPRGNIAGGISNIVAGSILTVLGAGSAAGGVAALVGAGAQPADSNGRTALTVIGWTFTGFGILLGCIGLPLLFVGIGRVASAGRPAVALTVSSTGNLAVTF